MAVAYKTPVTIPDDAYDASSWDSNLQVPTKNAIRDKIESMLGLVVPYAETPSGTVNSSNTVFTIANTPANSAGVIVVLDGVVQYNGTDFTVSGSTITFSSAPTTGSTIFAYYNTSASEVSGSILIVGSLGAAGTFGRIRALTTDGNAYFDNGVAWVNISTILAVNPQSGTTYTLVLADKGAEVRTSNSSAKTVTISSTSTLGTDFLGSILNTGAGVLTLAPAGGVTLRRNTKIVQYKSATIKAIGTDEYLITASSGQLDLDINDTDDTYKGITIAGYTAGGTIAQWDAVYLDGSSTWQKADANGSGTYPARGLAVAGYSSTDPAIILTNGIARNDSWSWTVGGTLYLSTTAGGLTQTAPSTSGDKIQQVGFALDADRAYLNFNGEYLTVT